LLLINLKVNIMFLRQLHFQPRDEFTGRTQSWVLYALATENGDCQIENFLRQQMSGGHRKAAIELLAFMEDMIFDPQGPRRWIGSKRCHESVSGQQIYEFRQGDLRLHWFYGQGKCVAVLARVVAKQRNSTPKPLAKELVALKSAYSIAANTGQLHLV
jgi:hypothetical protein